MVHLGASSVVKTINNLNGGQGKSVKQGSDEDDHGKRRQRRETQRERETDISLVYNESEQRIQVDRSWWSASLTALVSTSPTRGRIDRHATGKDASGRELSCGSCGDDPTVLAEDAASSDEEGSEGSLERL
jgi:hypothetical protein